MSRVDSTLDRIGAGFSDEVSLLVAFRALFALYYRRKLVKDTIGDWR